VSYSDSHVETVSFSSWGGDLSYVFNTRDADLWELGLQGFAGVEWYVNDLFSLHAEYAVTGHYVIRDEVEHRIESDDPDDVRHVEMSRRSPKFNSDGVRLGLSAHF
jgi:opacity protein-like surface antigen